MHPTTRPVADHPTTPVDQAAPDHTPDRPGSRADQPTDSPVVGRPGRLSRGLDNAYAYTVLIAPLAVAGYFQAQAAHARLDLPWFWAVAFTVSWEGAAGYIARLYLRALLRGDSTVVLRLAMMVYAAVSCGLLWWHLDHVGKAWHLAAAVGALTLSGIFLWARRARDMRRDELYARGLVDAAVVRFSLASWLAAPIETPLALRYAIKHRIERPTEAIEAYRTARQRRRMARALVKARSARRRDAGNPTGRPVGSTTSRPVPTSQPTGSATPDHPTTVAGDRPTTAPASDRKPTGNTRPPDHQPTGLRLVHGPTAIADAAMIRATYGTRPPGRNELIRAHGGNAGRWTNALKAYRDSADLRAQTA